MTFSINNLIGVLNTEAPLKGLLVVDPLGIEPRSVSRLVSLSFTCVVVTSLATEFVDSAYDLFPC